MKTYNLDIKIIFSYIDFNILASILSPGEEMIEKKGEIHKKLEKKRIIQNIRHIYKYFLYGISGGTNEL